MKDVLYPGKKLFFRNFEITAWSLFTATAITTRPIITTNSYQNSILHRSWFPREFHVYSHLVSFLGRMKAEDRFASL